MKQSARGRTTVFQDMSAPTAMVRSLLQGFLPVCVVIPLCCAFPPVKEAAFHLSLLVLIVSHLRELKGKLRFFFWGRADGLRPCWVDAGQMCALVS